MKQGKNGYIVENLSNAEYHAGEGISKSDLDMLHKCAAYFRYEKDNPADEASAALILGSAFHTLTLEPEKFEAEYIVAPKIDRRTKEGKTAWAEIQSSGKEVLGADDYSRLLAMRDSVMENPIAAELIEKSRHEISMYGHISGELCKCRPDIWAQELNVLADLKTTQDASPEGFRRSVAKFRYYVQAAWYLNVAEQATGIAPRDFIFIAVEKEPPYLVGIYNLDEAAKNAGYQQALEDLRTYCVAKADEDWRGYSQTVVELSLPRWATAVNE